MKRNTFTLLRQKTPKITGSLIRMRQETFQDAERDVGYEMPNMSLAILRT